ncbi:phage tail tape measure protein [Weissella paramesenteroides]|uniref:phage tail tape measure protein n=1 Tax=Weissella paramesenteroides TaxID=1249 RepID=UPI002E7B5677|nr:phage tail tape measure protein [Weissella paramesenteroides]WPQ68435.1 phage tail tape measure protein [Weissella paramesenteroides]
MAFNGGQVVAHIGADITDYNSAMKTISSSTSNAASSAKQSLAAVGKVLAVTGAAITAVGVKSLKGFGDFQQSLNQAAVIAGGTSKDIQGLSDVANEMGAVLPLSAQDAADAMVAMARDGASISTIKKEFPAIAQAATAAGADLQTTASVVQQSMNIWGKSLKSPQQAAAILTQTANLSNASIEDMQQALATIGGTASNAGIDMKTTASAIGLLTNRGFSAAQASQDLNHAILQMQAPSKIARGQMDDLGLSFVDAQGNMKPLPQILGEISDSMSNMTSSEKAAALKKMFGTSGMAAILPLMDSVKDKTDNTTTSWDAFTKKMDGASDSTQTATKFLAQQAEEMQKNLGSKIEQVGGNWEALSNKAMASSAGVTGAFLDMTNSALEWAGSSNSSVAGFIRQILGLTPVIGGAVTATGAFLTSATKIGSVLKTTSSAITGLLISPLGLAITALGLFAGAISLAYKYSQPFRDAISNVGKAFNQVFGPALSGSSKSVKDFGGTVTNVMQKVSEAFGDKLAKAINSVNWVGVFTSIKNVMAGVLRVATKAVAVFGELAVKIANSGAAATAWHIVRDALKVTYDMAKVAYDMFKDMYDMLGQIGGQGSTTGKALQSAFGIAALLSVPLGIKLLPKAIGLILSPVRKLGGAFGGVLGKLVPFSNTAKKATDVVGASKKPYSNFATKLLEVGAGVGIAAGGLGALALGVSQLAKQGDKGTGAMTTFALSVGILVGEFALFGGALTTGAIGIGALLGGLTAVALAFTALASTGKQGQSTMITFALSISGVVTVFAVLGPLLTAGATGMLAFGAAVLLVGAGVALFGTGINLVAQAITLLSTNMSAIIPVMTAMGVGFALMITGFITQVLVAVPQITQAFFSMLTQIMTQAVTYVPVITALFLQMVTGFLNQLITYVPQITGQFITLLLGVINTVTTYVPQITAAFVGLLLSIISSFTNYVPQIADKMTNLLLALMRAVADNGPRIVAGFAAMLGDLAAAMVEIMPYISQLMGAMMAALAAIVIDYGKTFKQLGGILIKSLGAGITGQKYDASKAAANVMKNAGSQASADGMKAFDAAGGNSAIKGLKAIENKKGDARTAGSNLGKSGADGVNSKSGDFRSAGSKLGDSAANGVKSKSGNTRSAGSSIGSSGASGARGQQGAFQSAGSFIGQGLVNGINSMAGPAMRVAASIASAAAGAIRRALKIHSPSRVTYALGEYVGAGLINGIASQQKAVAAAASLYADAIQDQKYEANARLTASSSAVAGKINGGLEALDSDVREQAAQSPIFEVYNELVGDKITTTVNSKNARRQSMTQFMNGGI